MPCRPGVPRVGEVEALSPEERADDDQHCPEHEVDRLDRDGELAVLRAQRRALVDVGGHTQEDQCHAGDRHAGDHRVEHREQFLQAQEVPRRLGRVGRLVVVSELEQRCVDEQREDQREGRDEQRCGELCRQQVRPDMHFVARAGLDVLDRARLDHGQQAVGVARRPPHERRQRGGHSPACCCGTACLRRSIRHHARDCGRSAGLLAGFEQRTGDRHAVIVTRLRGGQGVAFAGRGRAGGAGPGFSASAQEVFGDLSHADRSGRAGCLQRPRNASVLSHSPEMDRHEDDDHERQHQDVQHVPAQ